MKLTSKWRQPQNKRDLSNEIEDNLNNDDNLENEDNFIKWKQPKKKI